MTYAAAPLLRLVYSSRITLFRPIHRISLLEHAGQPQTFFGEVEAAPFAMPSEIREMAFIPSRMSPASVSLFMFFSVLTKCALRT